MSAKNLFTALEFCLITFETTHEALKAEDVLRRNAIHFISVPVPREISSGCGLSIRIANEEILNAKASFDLGNVKYSVFYKVSSPHDHKVYQAIKETTINFPNEVSE